MQVVWGKECLGDVLYLGGCDVVYLSEKLADVPFFSVVEEVFGEVEGELLVVVAGNGNLSFQLSLGCRQLAVAQGMLHDAVQFTVYQTQAALHVVVVAAEIDRPAACVAISRHRALDGINQSLALAEREVQTGIHSWAAEDVVQQIKRHATSVVPGKRLTSQHDVSLMMGI